VTNVSGKYHNPRIDHSEVASSAIGGHVYLDVPKSIWVLSMLSGSIIGGALTISLSSVMLFFFFTGLTLCLGHSLGMHVGYVKNG